MAFRHYCSSSLKSFRCTKGDGKPKRQKCAYCGGQLVTEQGVYGAFDWTGENRYPAENALKTFRTDKACEAWIRGHPEQNRGPGGLVSRWIPA